MCRGILFFSDYFHTWSWARSTLIGVWILGLPLEEYMFMMLVPMMLIGAALIFRVSLYEPPKRLS